MRSKPLVDFNLTPTMPMNHLTFKKTNNPINKMVAYENHRWKIVKREVDKVCEIRSGRALGGQIL